MSVTGATWLVQTLASYQTRVSVFDPGVSPGWFQALAADPRRWWVQFQAAGGGGTTMPAVVPGEDAPPVPNLAPVPSPQQWKFPDCPSVVTGPWWVEGGAGAVVITECLYVGG